MLQYSPDKLQWLLLTSSAPLGLILFVAGALLLIWLAYRYLRNREQALQKSILAIGIPGLLLVAGGLVIPNLAPTSTISDEVVKNLSETAKFQDVKVLHLETVSNSPFTTGSVSFIGTATDVDGDPRQFRYTQYESFGVYDMVGFDKPAVNLKDESFSSTEKGVEEQKQATESPAPEATPSESPSASQSVTPAG